MNPWLRRIGYTLGAVVALLLVAVGAVYAVSESRFRRTYDVTGEALTATNDSATLARGEHLVTAITGCVGCHGEGLRGNPVIDASPMGRIVAPNLTRGEGGVGAQLTAQSIERAVRHGIGRDGRALRIMPSPEYQYLSDEDARAVVSYVLGIAPANNTLAPSKLMLLPRALMVGGVMPLLPAEALRDSAGTPMSATPGATKEYGAYLSMVAGCKGCHGLGLSGGKIEAGDPAWGPAANLTPSGNLGKWSEADFVQTMRTGKRPDGYELKEPMPWKTIGKMTDDELRALWVYLQSVPAKDFGRR
jgi:mono/diheme cytochrome c family protein